MRQYFRNYLFIEEHHIGSCGPANSNKSPNPKQVQLILSIKVAYANERKNASIFGHCSFFPLSQKIEGTRFGHLQDYDTGDAKPF